MYRTSSDHLWNDLQCVDCAYGVYGLDCLKSFFSKHSNGAYHLDSVGKIKIKID